MRHVYTCILSLVAIAAAACLAPTARAIPIVQYSTDGKHYKAITLLQTAMTGSAYYSLGKHSGNPAFGVAKGKESVAMIWDTTHSELSLVFISGGSTVGERGKGKLVLGGMPNTASLKLSDDNGEFTTSHRRHKLFGKFGYRDSTDGFVLGGMNGTAYTAKLTVTPGRGVDGLRLVDGDPLAGGKFVGLTLGKPLYLKVGVGATDGTDGTGGTGGGGGGGGGGGVGTPVPEPTSMGLLCLAGLAILKRPRRHRPAAV